MDERIAVLINTRTIDLAVDGPLTFAELVTMILPDVRELAPGATFAAVLKVVDRSFLAEWTRRMRAAGGSK